VPFFGIFFINLDNSGLFWHFLCQFGHFFGIFALNSTHCTSPPGGINIENHGIGPLTPSMAAKFLSHGHGDVSVKAESEVILSSE
jgi:hypothetical protein